jgi:hypothetical protein
MTCRDVPAILPGWRVDLLVEQADLAGEKCWVAEIVSQQ